MTNGLIGDYPAADDREQIGRFLRHAFPLGAQAFAELLRRLENKEQVKSPSPQ
jgi:hypothetical protein